MTTKKSWLLLSAALLLVAGCDDDNRNVDVDNGDDTPPASFQIVEGTIAGAHAAMRSGSLTCEDLVGAYIDRIRAYDRAGPGFRSAISINPLAINRARMLDVAYDNNGLTGPLHCVPVLLKDNFDTEDVATTAGGLVFVGNRPPDDAFVVDGLIDDGAIILGKANLDEFAFGFQGSSSVGGQVKNAYDPTKGPGGSSSGTGTAIAASFAMTGMGSDTGGSVRVPSSLNGLVGIRPSLRLLSQDGIVPLAASQDTAGPMCRTVADCALMLDALVGFDDGPFSNQRVAFDYDAENIDSEDAYEAITQVPDTYTDALDENALDGARIAAIQPLFGDGEGDNAQVQAALMQAIENMRAAGATVDILSAEDLAERNVVIDDLTGFPSNSRFEFRQDLTTYLMSWSSDIDGHPRDFETVAESGLYLPRNESTFAFYGEIGRAIANPEDLSESAVDYRQQYQRNLEERPGIVRGGLMRILENRTANDDSGRALGEAYDVLLYPSILSLAPELGNSPNAGSNNRLSPFSGFPAISLPAGMVSPETMSGPPRDAPDLPVGMEMLAREFDEETLIGLAYSYQQAFQPREAPTFTPALAANDD